MSSAEGQSLKVLFFLQGCSTLSRFMKGSTPPTRKYRSAERIRITTAVKG